MKNKEKLNEALNNIDDKMIETAYARQAEKRNLSGLFGKIGSVAAIIAIAIFAVVLSHYAHKDPNISASSGNNESGEKLLYEDDFKKFWEHNIGFTTDDGMLEYELKLFLPSDEHFFFKCYAKVINRSGNEIELHRIADRNSFFYIENDLKNAEYEQTLVYNGDTKADTVKLKPGGSYEELLTYTDGVKANMKSDFVQRVHDVSGYLTVTVNLDPAASRTWGKSYTWFEGSYYKNNGKTVKVGEDDYGCFICGDQKIKGLEGFVCDSYDDPISGQHIEADGSGISEELKSMENPPTLHYKTGDTIDYIIDPALSFGGFQLWYVNAYNTIDFGGDLYKYLDANPGQYYITAEQYKGSRYTTMGVKLIVETNMPADFSFSLVWNTYGISSYDSKTGTLIKTSDATDVSKYTTAYKMNDRELSAVYNLLIQLKDYPDNYDPYNDPASEIQTCSEPNRTVIIKFTSDGIEKTITCKDICYGVTGGYDDAANKFLQIEKQIEDMLTNTKQWQTLPEYEVFYD
ncbi:MAG: hypothetical protein IJT49_08770 [Clostridia bacterium]|nr:hypothetical protein [Clostridia bacterium]